MVMGVAWEGRGDVKGPCPPIVDWADFFNGKTGIAGAVLSTRSVLWASNMPKMRWRPGLRPGPRRGSSRRSPFPGWGGRHPSPNPTLLGAFGASILAPSALSFCATMQNPGYALAMVLQLQVWQLSIKYTIMKSHSAFVRLSICSQSFKVKTKNTMKKV